ncbi:MAG: TIGR01777 family oxidoreductase [Acidobacteria bacterium]|nr:TIGR01777 family oxidoreductase [Acidobacteriota bacterium]
MRILITGSTGLVGSALVSHLAAHRHRPLHMVRRPPRGDDEIRWDIEAGTLDPSSLEGLDAVVHLAGENIASGRWTAERKRRIMQSRVLGTRLLARSLARLDTPPRVLISVSAVGYYGDRGEEALDEESGPGTGFLAEVCRAWEAEAAPAAERGIRVVHPRLGMVLSARGGALDRMLPAFRAGFGGRIGSGRQYMSWIALDDLVGVILHAIEHDTLHGPVNAVSPHPVTNADFTRVLARALGRPALLALPAFTARLALGQMADELLLASARVSPRKLEASGYRFLYPRLEDTLGRLFGPESK